MRHFLLLVLSLCGTWVYSQTETPYPYSADSPEWVKMMYQPNADIGKVHDAYYAYYKDHSFVKNQHTQYFKRWVQSHQQYQYQPRDAENLRNETRYIQESLKLTRAANDWECIGPFDYDEDAAGMSYAAGSAHIYTVEQARSNTDVIYAGTATAGMWKSIDKGENWALMTRDLVFTTVYAIEIDHQNEDVVYISGDNKLWKTTDGGSSWAQAGDASFKSQAHSIKDIALHPSSNTDLFVASDKGLYRSADAGNSFTQVISGEVQEIEFHPSDPSIVYAIRLNGNKTEFYKSGNSGSSFSLKSTGWPSPGQSDEQKRTEIAVSPASPNRVVAFCTGKVNGGSGLYGMYVSTNAGESWAFNCCGPQPGGTPSQSNMNLTGWSDMGDDDGGQYYYDLALALLEDDSNKVFAGAVNLWHSDNGGSSFYCPAKWSHSGDDQYVHADIHDIKIYGDDIWIACDGGVFYSNDKGATFNKKSKDIAGTDFWGFGMGSGPTGRRVMVGGTYHNGTHLMDNDVFRGGWNCIRGGDNYRGFVNQADDRFFYDDNGGHELSGSRTISASPITFTKKPNATYTIGKSSELIQHPHIYTTFFVGEGNSLWKSTDNGANFSQLHDFGLEVADIDVSPVNPDIIYVATFDSYWGEKSLYRTTNGGANWTKITPPSNLNPKSAIPYAIVASGTDENTVWIARTPHYTDANDGYKVLKSTNMGSTWTNLTTSTLNGELPRDIIEHEGSNGGVYLSTTRAVYYRDNSMNDWQLYNSNLPLATPSWKLQMDYWGGKVVNATGRSVYECDLVGTSSPISHPGMDKTEVSCENGVINYADLSTVYSDVEYEWAFPGGIPNKSTEANPVVNYRFPGTYDVTLKVTDKNGTDTKVLSNFITVTGNCANQLDGALISLKNKPSEESCEVDYTPVVTVANYGSEILTSYTLKLYINDELKETQEILTLLGSATTEEIPFSSVRLTAHGENTLRVEFSSPNNGVDENTEDNSLSFALIGTELNHENYAAISATSDESHAQLKEAFDGDLSTIWHSGWSTGVAPLPHELVMDMGSSMDLHAINFINRQDNPNGFLDQAELFVSEDESNWGDAQIVNFASTTQWQTIYLNGKKGRYVKLKINSTMSGDAIASIAEIRFVGCSDTQTSISNVHVNPLQIFPNPSSSELFLDRTIQGSFEIMNIWGETVQQGFISENQLSLQGLSNGQYILRIRNNDESHVFRFVKI